MTVNELINDYNLIPELTLICVESLSGECFFCGQRGEYKPERDYKIRALIPESYGKYYGSYGITILVD